MRAAGAPVSRTVPWPMCCTVVVMYSTVAIFWFANVLKLMPATTCRVLPCRMTKLVLVETVSIMKSGSSAAWIGNIFVYRPRSSICRSLSSLVASCRARKPSGVVDLRGVDGSCFLLRLRVDASGAAVPFVVEDHTIDAGPASKRSGSLRTRPRLETT